MSVKSAVFVLWCVGVSLSHPVTHKDGRIDPMDHMDAQIVQNFDHPSVRTNLPENLEMAKFDQYPFQYPLRPRPYSFEQDQRPIFSTPSFLPEDVELVNSQGKPIQFKPTINDVELFMPTNGKPIPFPKEGEMSDMMPGMGREQSMPLMVTKDGSKIEMGQPHVMLVNRQPIMGQERVGMPTIIQRDSPEMMSMMMEKQGPHMMPMHMEIPMHIEREGSQMMPIHMERDGSQMMPVEGPQMMQMHMEREGSQMMPMPMNSEGSHMMPMTIQREHLTMPVMMDEGKSYMMMQNRLKRQETTTPDLILNHTQNRNVLEKEFLSLLDKTLDKLEKQNIIIYPINTKEIIITDNQSKDTSLNPIDQNMQQNTSLNALDSQNEITNEELAIMDQVINDQQKLTTMRVFESMYEKREKMPKTDEIMNDELTETSPDTKDHQNEQTPTNGEPSKEISPEIKDEQEKQNATSNIFHAINPMNEVKHQQLAETDKIMNEEPATEKITEDDQNKSPTTFDETSSTDKFPSNDQPSMENMSNERINTFALETSTISLFDSQNEKKNRDSSAVDPTISKPTAINELAAAQMKFMQEMAKIDKLFLEQDLTQMHTLTENDFAYMKPVNIFDSKNQQNKEITSILETSTTISEVKTQTDKQNNEPIRVTSLSPGLLITEIFQEINYDPMDPTSSKNQNQTNPIGTKVSKEQGHTTTDIVPTTQSPKASKDLNTQNIVDLARLLSIMNADFGNIATEPPHSRQSEVVNYNNFNKAGNFPALQPITIPLAENYQPRYRYIYSNYPTVYYQ